MFASSLPLLQTCYSPAEHANLELVFWLTLQIVSGKKIDQSFPLWGLIEDSSISTT